MKSRGSAPVNALSRVGDVGEPLLVRVAAREFVDQLCVVVELALGDIDGDHLARADATALQDDAIIERAHAGFRADCEQAIFGARITQRPQPVAVEPGDGPAPVEDRQRRGAVPRLHHRVRVRIERAVRFRHRRRLRPGFGHQQRLRRRRAAASADQNLKHVVERRRVRAAWLHHRLHVRARVAECI